MSRKAYSEQERKQIKEALLVTMLQCINERGLIHSSIEFICRRVGISKSYFYSFFSSKEELVLYALQYQQPKLLQYAKMLMDHPGLSWREGVGEFLKNCCYGNRSGIAVLSIEEAQEVYHCLNPENFQVFQQNQMALFSSLMKIFGVPVSAMDPRLFGNMILTMIMVHKAIPDTMPFLFPETAGDMVVFQIDSLIDKMEQAKNTEVTNALY